jgi:hypothetical protein
MPVFGRFKEEAGSNIRFRKTSFMHKRLLAESLDLAHGESIGRIESSLDANEVLSEFLWFANEGRRSKSLTIERSLSQSYQQKCGLKWI